MDDSEREQFNQITRNARDPQHDKASPAALLVVTFGFTCCILVFGMTWVWTGDERYLVTGLLFLLAFLFLAAGISAFQRNRK